MKKLIGTLIGALVLILVLSSCSKKIVPVSVRDSIVSKIEYVKHDSLIYISDSASLTALFYCDSVGKIHLKQLQDYYHGQLVTPSIVVKDNYVTVNCVIDSSKVSFSWLEKNTSVLKVRAVTQTIEVNKLHWWQTWLCWIGGACVLLIVIFLVYQFALNKFKILSLLKR